MWEIWIEFPAPDCGPDCWGHLGNQLIDESSCLSVCVSVCLWMSNSKRVTLNWVQQNLKSMHDISIFPELFEDASFVEQEVSKWRVHIFLFRVGRAPPVLTALPMREVSQGELLNPLYFIFCLSNTDPIRFAPEHEVRIVQGILTCTISMVFMVLSSCDIT